MNNLTLTARQVATLMSKKGELILRRPISALAYAEKVSGSKIDWIKLANKDKTSFHFAGVTVDGAVIKSYDEKSPYAQGEVIKIKEDYATIMAPKNFKNPTLVKQNIYLADYVNFDNYEEYANDRQIKWCSGLRMPDKYVRHHAVVTDIDICRLQDFSLRDAYNEGLISWQHFQELKQTRLANANDVIKEAGEFPAQWDKLYKSQGYEYGLNVMVWKITLKLQRPEPVMPEKPVATADIAPSKLEPEVSSEVKADEKPIVAIKAKVEKAAQVKKVVQAKPQVAKAKATPAKKTAVKGKAYGNKNTAKRKAN